MYIFAWDDEKSAWNERQRGFSFEFASRVFSGRTLEREDLRRAYGEVRMVAVGIVDNVYLTVVFTDRIEQAGCVRRIISARPSNRKERKAYGIGLSSR